MDIYNIIKTRAKLQSTKKALDELGVDIYTLRDGGLQFKLNKELDPDAKKQLIITLGGRVNYRETERFLATL